MYFFHDFHVVSASFYCYLCSQIPGLPGAITVICCENNSFFDAICAGFSCSFFYLMKIVFEDRV